MTCLERQYKQCNLISHSVGLSPYVWISREWVNEWDYTFPCILQFQFIHSFIHFFTGWVVFNSLSHSSLPHQVQSNGSISIPSSVCRFNGAKPSAGWGFHLNMCSLLCHRLGHKDLRQVDTATEVFFSLTAIAYGLLLIQIKFRVRSHCAGNEFKLISLNVQRHCSLL